MLPDSTRMCPVAVARLLLVIARDPESDTILPVARARSVRILRIVPERAFCARESVK